MLLVPRFKFLTCFGGHGFGHVVVSSRHGSHVRLVFGDFEFVGKVALFEFSEPKGFGKRRQRHLKETEGFDETDDLVAFDLQEFAPVADLFHLLVVGVVLVHHKIPIVPLEIMSDDVDGTRLVLVQGIQPFEKTLRHTGLLGNERVEGCLRFRPRSDWPHAVLGVAWPRCRRTRAGVAVFRRPTPPPLPHHHHRLLPHWPAGLGDQRQHLVWREDLLDVDVFVCVPFSALGFLKG